MEMSAWTSTNVTTCSTNVTNSPPVPILTEVTRVDVPMVFTATASNVLTLTNVPHENTTVVPTQNASIMTGASSANAKRDSLAMVSLAYPTFVMSSKIRHARRIPIAFQRYG